MTEKPVRKIDWKKQKTDLLLAVKDKKRWIICAIEIAIIGLLLLTDLLTKKYIYGHCETDGDIIIIKNFARFTAVRNTGAAFGLFGSNTGVLAAISLICFIGLLFFICYSYKRRNPLLRIALVLIAAGAIGNNIDRMWLKYVRDFIWVEFFPPVFNFADSCLTIGTILLALYVLFIYSKEEKEKEEAKRIEVSAIKNELKFYGVEEEPKPEISANESGESEETPDK